MFNPEKLLGGMLRGSSGIKGLGRKAGIGSGLLGIAFAAAEHLMNKTQGQSSGGSMSTGDPSPSPGMSTPPPSPPEASSGSPPPPPPGTSNSPPPPPAPAENNEQDALLLIRAMIASAASDGEIDEQEKQNIITRLESVELSEEERDFIQKELVSPCTLDTITDKVNTPELARQVYTVSVMAIDVDTVAERDYLNKLGEQLKLDQAVKDEIHKELEVRL